MAGTGPEVCVHASPSWLASLPSAACRVARAVVRCTDLPKTQLLGRMQPYVIVRYETRSSHQDQEERRKHRRARCLGHGQCPALIRWPQHPCLATQALFHACKALYTHGSSCVPLHACAPPPPRPCHVAPDGDRNPEFQESFSFVLTGERTVVEFTIMNDKRRDEPIGTARCTPPPRPPLSRRTRKGVSSAGSPYPHPSGGPFSGEPLLPYAWLRLLAAAWSRPLPPPGRCVVSSLSPLGRCVVSSPPASWPLRGLVPSRLRKRGLHLPSLPSLLACGRADIILALDKGKLHKEFPVTSNAGQ